MKLIINRSVNVLYLLVLVALPSCVDNLIDKINNIEDLSWNPELAIPLGGGSFTIDDFIDDLEGEDFTISTKEDGLLVFNYSVDEVFSTTAGDLIEIEDQSHSILLQPDLSLIPDFDIPVTGTFDLTETHEFDVTPPDGDKLYQLFLKEGELQISAVGDFPGSGELLINFEHVTKNSIPLEVAMEWTYNGTASQELERTINLKDYQIDYTNNGTTDNYISFATTISVTVDNQLISLSDGLDVDLGFWSLDFSQVFASIQARSFSTENYQMIIEFMDDVIDGDFYFDEPSISININNSFGVPLQIAILDMLAQSETNGDLELTGDIADAPQAIAFPSIDEIGQSDSTTITINHENSNLPSILSWQPDTILYTFEGSVKESDSEDVHFILDNSSIEATIDIEVPWIGRIEDITFEDSIDFTGGDLEDVDDEIANALFRLTTTNGLPVNATVQLYFISEFGTLIDSLFYNDGQILDAGQVDNTGRVSQATTKVLDVVVEGNRLTAITEARSILVKSQLSTAENGSRSIRMYNDDRLSFSLFIQTEFDIIF